MAVNATDVGIIYISNCYFNTMRTLDKGILKHVVLGIPVSLITSDPQIKFFAPT